MIGILTFHNTVNYGAMLQTYALQKYINSRGVPCEVVDYRCKQLEEVERPIKLLRQRTPKGVLKYLKCHRYQVNKWNRFQAFLKNNVSLSKRAYTSADITDADSEYSAFVVGSDQVWNTDITNSDYTYFLDFVKDGNKKYSYAASLGYSEWPDDGRDSAVSFLGDFKSLNVREQRAKELIDSALGEARADVVVDPTLLLSKEEWSRFAKKDELSDLIVVYMIDFKKEVFDFIRELAQQTGCKVVYVHDAIRSQSGMINSRDDTVEDFITMLSNARYVVTGSFHALCMSLKLEKQFYYTLSSTGNRNSRLENLISIAGLSHRRVVDGKCDGAPINYADVNSRLADKISRSKDILDGMLNEIENK